MIFLCTKRPSVLQKNICIGDRSSCRSSSYKNVSHLIDHTNISGNIDPTASANIIKRPCYLTFVSESNNDQICGGHYYRFTCRKGVNNSH